jgi:phage terminase large subunit
VAAHDPSDTGSDAKGYCLRHGSVILRVDAIDVGEIDEGCDWATGQALNDQADWFVWDGDGMGAGLKRQVSDAFTGTRTQFQMFRGSLSGIGQDNARQVYMLVDNDKAAQSKIYADTFRNNRAQYYWMLRDKFYKTYLAVVKGHYVDPAEMISLASVGISETQRLRSEVCRVPQKQNAHGLIQIMNKQEMKRLKIDSPNMIDAIMMSQFTPPMVRKEWVPPKVITRPRSASSYGRNRRYS